MMAALIDSRSLLILCGLLGFTLADYCPDVKVIEKLDLQKLVGDWWVWDSSGMITYTEIHTCHSSHFYSLTGGKSLSVMNDYLYWTNKPNHVRYSWLITDENPTPDGNLTTTMKLARMGEKQVPFLVLDTDYTRYLLVHMCKDVPNYLAKMKSTLTLLRNLTFSKEEQKDISSKVELALKKSSLTREDLGLFHTDTYTKNCSLPKWPKSVKDGKSTIIDTETLTATVNGLAAHAGHAVEDAYSLAKDAVNEKITRKMLAARFKHHAEDVKALASGVKNLSTL